VFLYIFAYIVNKDINRATFTKAIPAVNVKNIFMCRIITMRKTRY